MLPHQLRGAVQRVQQSLAAGHDRMDHYFMAHF
jgi:hypothetical protein